MRTLALAFFVLGCIAGVAWLALSCEVTEPPRFAISRGPWSVDGVALGDDEAACRRAFGDDADETAGRDGTRTLRWRRGRERSVTLDAAGHVCEVLGATLTERAGGVALPNDATLDEARRALPDADEQEFTRPGGGGVITVSRVLLGTSLTVTDDRGSYSVGFDAAGRLQQVRASVPQPKRRR